MNYKEQYKLLMKQQKQEQKWSARQAKKQMDFQRMMSDTAHQREVKDLQAAGLNPVLSAGGNGASSATGAMAEQSSIIPELAELLRAAGSSHGGGTNVVVNNEEPNKPSQYFTARQFEQGIHAGQGAYHGTLGSRAVKVAKDKLDNARDGLWKSIEDVRIGARPNLRSGGVVPTANGTGKDLHKIYDAVRDYNKAVAFARNQNLHNTVSSKKYVNDLREWLSALGKRVDPEMKKKIQDMIYY